MHITDSEQIFKFLRMSPEISIIIPVYNRRKFLLRAIRSIYLQTFTDYEIIVVDDGSEDDLLPIIEALEFKNLSYFKLPHKNANVARNYGINKSIGNYIAMLDSDDEWLPHHLESNLQIMNLYVCDGIFSSVLVKRLNNENIFRVRPLYDNEQIINYLLLTEIGAQTSTLFMKTGSVRKILWDETLNRHQDYDFVVRFGKEFEWYTNFDVTTIYHCENNLKTNIDFDSCIQFIEKNRKDILPSIYSLYCKRMLNYAILLKSSQRIINYYTNQINIQ